MISLDDILDGLTVDVRPFGICEARGDGVIALSARNRTTLHYVLSGAGTFAIDGVSDLETGEGTILVVPAHVEHRLRAAPKTDCEVLNCAPLDSNWTILQEGQGANGVIVACSEIEVGYRGISGLFNYLQTPLICRLETGDLLKTTLDQILTELATPQAGSRALVRALMQQCMIYLLRQTGHTSPSQIYWLTAAYDERLWRAVVAILDNPAKNHTVDTLSEIATMSRSSFADHFRKAFQRGPIDLLKQARLQLAVRLLVSTDLSVKSISQEVGYTSRSYFSRAFSDRYGKSPAAYRENHRNFRP